MKGLRDFTLIYRAAMLSNGSIAMRVRGNGVLQDPNDLALGLITAMPFCWLAWTKGRRFRNLFLVWLPTAVMLATMYYTKSRGGMVALLAILGLMWSRRLGVTKTALMLGLISVAMVGLKFTGGRMIAADDSSEGRIDAWGEGFHMFQSHPLLGVGYNGFIEHHQITAHNSFVLCFSEGGLTGYFLWIFILVSSMMLVRNLMKIPGTGEAADRVRRWAGTLQLSMCGFIVGGFFLSRTWVYVFYMLAAMICALAVAAWNEDLEVQLPGMGSMVKRTLLIQVASMVVIYCVVRLNWLIT